MQRTLNGESKSGKTLLNDLLMLHKDEPTGIVYCFGEENDTKVRYWGRSKGIKGTDEVWRRDRESATKNKRPRLCADELRVQYDVKLNSKDPKPRRKK